MPTTLQEEELDSLFTALSDRTRRDIVARLSAGEATVKELAEPYAMSLQAVLEQLTDARGEIFGTDLTDVRLEATDTGWSWGSGRPVSAETGELVALLSGRTLPDGQALPPND